MEALEALEALDMGERAELLAGHPTSTKQFRHCSPLRLPSGGVVVLSPGSTITLTAEAVYTPQCTALLQNNVDDIGGGVAISSQRDPFHASITPQAYATGAATVIAWMLVIMLIITPRTFFVGGASGRSGLMGRRGMISGATGGGSVIGVGTRPWLQKVAALTVAVSLTIATADTFKIAGRQYAEGYMDAMKLRDLVVSAMEIKVSRVISDVFLWLAQVQTLIRLFPRHKEKVIIKWVGFALILLDMTFTSLNSFGPYNTTRNPRRFETAIPALSYLFQLSLSMLYAAWVMYYAITKRRYAFYHSMMWNITIVALLSIVAILTPVVFFITDICNHTIAGWGDYFRWVGAAAASVIVWEWVERIEALEREERKDGILGREVYDGDEMLDSTPSHEVWPRGHRKGDSKKKPGDTGNGRGLHGFSSGANFAFGSLLRRPDRLRRKGQKPQMTKRASTIHVAAPTRAYRRREAAQNDPQGARDENTNEDVLPVATISSPVDRIGTASADSTVYTIRYHPVSVSPAQADNTVTTVRPPTGPRNENEPQAHQDLRFASDPERAMEPSSEKDVSESRSGWVFQISNLFRRKGRSPPPEVHRGRVIEPLGVEDVSSSIPPRSYSGLALKDRLGTFAAQQGERLRTKMNTGQPSDANLPVTIIPAQPRGRTWSPQQNKTTQIIASPLSQVSATPGLHAADDTLDTVEENHVSSSPAACETRQPTRATAETPSIMARRPSHVRFAPSTLGRPMSNADVAPENDAHTWSAIPSASCTRRSQSDAGPGGESFISQSPTHNHAGANLTATNHDR